MIRYVNNASNEIEYTAKDGTVIRRNPFDPEFVLISQRLSDFYANEALNQQNRNNYERAVKNAQVSIDAGRTPEELPPMPLMAVTPEDFHEPVYTVATWNPPLLTLKPASGVNTPDIHGFGPDAIARQHSVTVNNAPAVEPAHPVVSAVAAMQTPAQDALATVLSVLASVGPALPSLLDLISALTAHHKATR